LQWWFLPDPDRSNVSMLALEELHRTLVLLGCGSAGKSAEVSPATAHAHDW
jgi:hypothetical protein